MGRYRIRESVGTTRQPVHSFEGLEIHHPSEGDHEQGRTNVGVDGGDAPMIQASWRSGHHKKWIVGALMMLMTAYNAAQVSEAEEASHPSLTAISGPRCPGQDFNKFLEVFVDSIEIQRAFTTLPLPSDSVDAEAEPEPRVVTRMLSDSELQFPVIPSTRQQLQQELTMSSHSSGSDMVVTLTKPETDYQMSYYFRHAACWMLSERAMNPSDKTTDLRA